MNIAVVVPCRNEAKNIEECVRAIYVARLPENATVSVYVVDGRSDDGTRKLLEQLQTEFPTLHIVDNALKVTPVAFNLGIHAAGVADYYQIIGARQVIAENYFVKAIAVFEQHPEVDCVGGSVENVYLNQTGRIIALAMSTAFGMGLGNFRTLQESGYTDTVGTPMYPARVFEKIGYFDEQLVRNQDDDFNFRVIQAGGKIWFERDISLRYYVRGDVKGLYRQFYQYGYWKVFVNRKHGAVTTMRQLVPPAFVAFVILSPLSLLLPLWMCFSVLGILALYCFLAVFFGIRKGKSIVQMVKIMGVFPVLHWSYGLGYLKGMWDFLVLRKQPSEKSKELTR